MPTPRRVYDRRAPHWDAALLRIASRAQRRVREEDSPSRILDPGRAFTMAIDPIVEIDLVAEPKVASLNLD